MGMPSTLADLADRQWRDYSAREPGTCFADPGFVLDLPQAYELQRAVSALRVAAGDRIVGYKVGCTGPGGSAKTARLRRPFPSLSCITLRSGPLARRWWNWSRITA